jgi:hypothetical protein
MFGYLRAISSSMAACASGGITASGRGLAASSKSSWVKPRMRLPSACITWCVRSTEKPAAVMGVLAIRRRDFVRHSVWMTRAYAVAVAAGTQAVDIAPWIILVGPLSELIKAMLMGLAWVINLAVAEFVNYRRAR